MLTRRGLERNQRLPLLPREPGLFSARQRTVNEILSGSDTADTLTTFFARPPATIVENDVYRLHFGFRSPSTRPTGSGEPLMAS